jgi:hypothetical protein
MKDTPTSIEQLFTRKLLDLAPDERLAMACRMFSAAKELIRAGISANGAMSAAEVRGLVFQRLYGQDFDQVKRAKILSRLGAT